MRIINNIISEFTLEKNKKLMANVFSSRHNDSTKKLIFILTHNFTLMHRTHTAGELNSSHI